MREREGYTVIIGRGATNFTGFGRERVEGRLAAGSLPTHHPLLKLPTVRDDIGANQQRGVSLAQVVASRKSRFGVDDP